MATGAGGQKHFPVVSHAAWWWWSFVWPVGAAAAPRPGPGPGRRWRHVRRPHGLRRVRDGDWRRDGDGSAPGGARPLRWRRGRPGRGAGEVLFRDGHAQPVLAAEGSGLLPAADGDAAADG